VSTGIKQDDFIRLKEILNSVPCNWICIDVANGYIQALVDFCKQVRKVAMRSQKYSLKKSVFLLGSDF
ncbi:MAG: hypothetical protein ACKO8H_07005, partial [Microcystis panniformis]